MNAKNFTGRAAIITGASSGIGRAVATRLGAEGMECWLVGRNADALAKTAAAIAAAGGSAAHCIAIDVAVPGAIAALVADLGHPHLHAMINCAGVMYPEPIVGSDMARWRELIDINVLALLEGSEAAIRRMREQGKPGHIINFSSLTARWDAGGVYGASKIAVEMIGRSLRKEVERDAIRIATIVPGGFASDLSRGFLPESSEMLGKIVARLGAPSDQVRGDPDRIADVVSFILDQPININLSEIVIRPPVSIEF